MRDAVEYYIRSHQSVYYYIYIHDPTKYKCKDISNPDRSTKIVKQVSGSGMGHSAF